MLHICKLGKGIHKPIQFSAVIEIARELHLPNGYYDSFKENEDDLKREVSSFVKITNFNITCFFTLKNLFEAAKIKIRNCR